ncbi:DUF5683 domain-containing protein [Porphyromonas pogonae]|uniref:DUF5683 domain-containing protein n=1 Tax=Porphyromonas pogonae TaxID=867595 RepID=UPI002E763421|nr:DUF5683 domain-containing protein [Porphyromonas pogonae]
MKYFIVYILALVTLTTHAFAGNRDLSVVGTLLSKREITTDSIIVRRDTLSVTKVAVPDSLNKARHHASDSLNNTQPTFTSAQRVQDTLNLKGKPASTQALSPKEQSAVMPPLNLWKPSSKKALLFAIIPGGGQVYNRKYWKLPIVWGAFTACAYAINWNNRTYKEYHNAYKDLAGPNPAKNTSWLAFAPIGTKPEDYPKYMQLRDNLKRGSDNYRRWRDLSIIVAVGVYALSILDAYVDAELFYFDISPDLSLRVKPELNMSKDVFNSHQIGLMCNLTF